MLPPPSLPDRPASAAEVRVLLADRAGSARRAVAGVLRELDGVALVGEIGDGNAVADALGRSGADVLLIDDRLLLRSEHVLAALHRGGVRVIVLGVDDDPAFAARARRLGAEAWLAKDRADEDLPVLIGGDAARGAPAR